MVARLMMQLRGKRRQVPRNLRIEPALDLSGHLKDFDNSLGSRPGSSS